MAKQFFQRKAVRIILIVIAGIFLIHLVSMLTLDRMIEYVETEYYSEKIDDSLDGYTVAFITDTHSISIDDLRAVVSNMNERGVDLLLLGGDYNGTGAEKTLEILSGTLTKDGIYGVEGNHDDYEELFVLMEQYGITPLDNTGTRLRDGLFLAGVQDLWNRRPNAEKAAQSAQPNEFVLLLSHNPDYSMQPSAAVGDIMLSGHTHGGQVTLFSVFAPVLVFTKISEYGQHFMSGWCEGAYCRDVYVSNGTGRHRFSPRVFSRPQVIYLTLRSK